jgi:dipeptidyl aminopeptidase/acylaminoacyl peptidase
MMPRPALVPAAALALTLTAAMIPKPGLAQQAYRTPSPQLAALVDAPPTPAVVISPDRARMAILEQPALPTIEEVARDELRLAGLRIDPANNGPSRARFSSAIRFQSTGGGAETAVTGLPAEARVRNVRWSPDGGTLAFTLDLPDRIEAWVADAATGNARRLLDAAVNDAFYGSALDWLPDGGGLVLRLVPERRAPLPAADVVPPGPVIQDADGEEAPARTYQDLLASARDEAVFEHYATSRLVVAGLDGSVRDLAPARLYSDNAVSPDGRYLLAEWIDRPFSYLVPASRFPTSIRVLDMTSGEEVFALADLPLAENVPTAFGSTRTGPRSVQWRADADATLAWVEALDGGDARADVEERDRLFALAAPFDGEPQELITLPLRYAGVQWGDGGLALVWERWFRDRHTRTYAIAPDRPSPDPTALFDRSYEDSYSDPGRPLMESTGRGTSVLVIEDGDVFMAGEGASEEGNRPFLRRLDPATGTTVELFRSAEPHYEVPVALLADGTLMTRRESVTEPPNYFVRDLDGGEPVAVTSFPHPYPELADVQKESIVYERDDGVQLTATMYLPAGYTAGSDDPLPGFVWAYPVEYKSADAAGQITDSPYQFNRVSYWGAVPFVTLGYAVFDDASMPIIGEGEIEPNDSFVEQLVASAEAVIDEGVRRGVLDRRRVGIAGHSYGAFMTANLLAHSDLFRAGVARSGAYNRTLTPFGFQREERTYWEAPEIYFAMSPFMHADDVDEPLLLIHGAADNNSGTYPMQSERYFAALKGHGAVARLVMLPHESHGYRARESILHMLWEMETWLNTYVRDADVDGGEPVTE